MTGQLARMVVAPLFILLAGATSASAECAWVLWEKETNPSWLEVKPGGPRMATTSTTWDVSGAGRSEAECGRQRTRVLNQRIAWLRNLSRLAASDGRRETVLVEDSAVTLARGTIKGPFPGDETAPGINTYAYYCLPDTVDPRGPKGK